MNAHRLPLWPLLVLPLASCAAEPCTLVDNDDGTRTLTCPDGTSTTIADGAAGPPGTDGTDGSDGTNGVDGADGTSCTVVDNGDGTKTITCDDGTSVVVRDGDAVFGDVTGRVALLNGESAADSTVRLVNDEDATTFTATTDELGVFAFDDVRAGLYTLIAEHEGYEPRAVPGVVVFDGIATLEPVRLVRAAFVGDVRSTSFTVSRDGAAAAMVEAGLTHRFDRERGLLPVAPVSAFSFSFGAGNRFLLGRRDGTSFILHDADERILRILDGFSATFDRGGAHVLLEIGTTYTRVDAASGEATTLSTVKLAGGIEPVTDDGVLFLEDEAGVLSLVAVRFSDGERQVVQAPFTGNIADIFVVGAKVALRNNANIISVDFSTTPFTVTTPSSTAVSLLGATSDGRFLFIEHAASRIIIHDAEANTNADFGIHDFAVFAADVPAFVSITQTTITHARYDNGIVVKQTATGGLPIRITRDGEHVLFRNANDVFIRTLPGTPVSLGTFPSNPNFEFNGDETFAVAAALTGSPKRVILPELSVSTISAGGGVPRRLKKHVIVQDGLSLVAIGRDTVSFIGTADGTAANLDQSGVIFASNPSPEVIRYFDDATGTTSTVTDRGTRLLGFSGLAQLGAVVEQREDCATCTDDGFYLFTAPNP